MPAPRASLSHRGHVAGLVLLLALLVAQTAQAQITREKPGRIRAANRRALREARATESPYKDSHLDVTRGQLRRGQSTQALPETRKDLDYKSGTAPNVQPPGFLGLRRKKNNLQHPPAQSSSRKNKTKEKE